MCLMQKHKNKIVVVILTCHDLVRQKVGKQLL